MIWWHPDFFAFEWTSFQTTYSIILSIFDSMLHFFPSFNFKYLLVIQDPSSKWNIWCPIGWLLLACSLSFRAYNVTTTALQFYFIVLQNKNNNGHFFQSPLQHWGVIVRVVKRCLVWKAEHQSWSVHIYSSSPQASIFTRHALFVCVFVCGRGFIAECVWMWVLLLETKWQTSQPAWSSL